MKKIILNIEGMTCSACSNGLEKYLKRQPKIKNASVNLVMATAYIECDDDVNITDLDEYIRDAGFKSLGPISKTNTPKKISKLPFIFYGILAIILMYISMSHMLSLPIICYLNMMLYPINYGIVQLILTIPFLIFGFDIFRNGIKSLYHRMPNMDTLVAIGVIASISYSTINVISVILGNYSSVENLYFESVVFVIYFIKLGRFIDANVNEYTKNAIKDLVAVTPKYAKIKTKDGFKEITIDEVKKGDILICYAKDLIAVDGTIIKGTTHTDESFITGESKPVKKSVKDDVIAGSINYDGTILYQAKKIGKESTISEIVKLVVEATNTKAPISLLADKICSYFVPTIIIIAFITLILSLLFKTPFNTALIRSVTVLVVACPCALGLATPLAIVTSVGVCAKRGILVKSSKIFELINKVNTVVFDKTGTLTKGMLTISEFNNYSSKEDKSILSILGSLESTSTHPIAKCIINYLKDKNIAYKTINNIEILDGKGVKGVINKHVYYAGNWKIIDDLKIKNKYLAKEQELSQQGNSIIYLVEDKKIISLIGVKDTLRDNAKEVVNALQNRNIEVIMLSGDNQATAKNIANEVGITNAIANCIPKEKVKNINILKKKHRIIAFVGDGVNDAPSLVTADVGISLSSGTDIATDSAEVILMNNNLMRIIDLLNISKNTMRIIKENLFWAFIYNIFMVFIASGLFSKWGITITPMLASATMVLSSLLVALNALRIKKWSK